LDAVEDLAVRDPSFWSKMKHAVLAFLSICIANLLIFEILFYSHSVGNVATKGLQIATNIVHNPLVSTALSIIPGGGAAESVFPSYVQNY
jgi:hypothetical protein